MASSAATVGTTATAISDPMRATSLLTADATPARAGSTEPIAVVVSAGTVSTMPRPKTSGAGQDTRQVARPRQHPDKQGHAGGGNERADRHRDPWSNPVRQFSRRR